MLFAQISGLIGMFELLTLFLPSAVSSEIPEESLDCLVRWAHKFFGYLFQGSVPKSRSELLTWHCMHLAVAALVQEWLSLLALTNCPIIRWFTSGQDCFQWSLTKVHTAELLL